jgi:hypothetical protein
MCYATEKVTYLRNLSKIWWSNWFSFPLSKLLKFVADFLSPYLILGDIDAKSIKHCFSEKKKN